MEGDVEVRNIACGIIGVVLASCLVQANLLAQQSRLAEVLLGQTLHQEVV